MQRKKGYLNLSSKSANEIFYFIFSKMGKLRPMTNAALLFV